MKQILLACAAAVLCVLGSCGGEEAGGGAPGRLRIAVIPKGTTHEFWQAIHRGAERAARELDVEVIWKGPLKENDRAEQIKVVEQFHAQGIDGIALAPLDFRALQRPVRTATDKGIPVVIFDSALEGTAGSDFVSFVATDNLEGGRMAGRELAMRLDHKGKVVMLRYQPGSASTNEREAGFLEVMAEEPGIAILSADQHAGASVESAKTKALNMLDQLREADGIFCPNESATVGMLRALQQENLLDRVTFVGFDATPILVEALRAGQIEALVVQDPVDMGYRAVRTLVERIRGEQVPTRIDTRVAVATSANLESAEIAPLLK
jgi:ribose transport system substrate-binding protein